MILLEQRQFTARRQHHIIPYWPPCVGLYVLFYSRIDYRKVHMEQDIQDIPGWDPC